MSIGQSIARITGQVKAVGTELSPDELVHRYGDDVWRFVSSRLSNREDAEDVVMEVFGIAFRNIQRLQKADSPRWWLLTIAKRKTADCLRRRYRRSEVSLEIASEHVSEPEQLGLHIKELVDRLPEAYREALVLKYVNGLETAEVAIIMKKTEMATNSLLQRARQALRELGLAELPVVVGRVRS
jgi:RNA polymerase sigma-70 factor (ECF subfamily)